MIRALVQCQWVQLVTNLRLVACRLQWALGDKGICILSCCHMQEFCSSRERHSETEGGRGRERERARERERERDTEQEGGRAGGWEGGREGGRGGIYKRQKRFHHMAMLVLMAILMLW